MSLDAARDLAARGFHIFPLMPMSKAPAIGDFASYAQEMAGRDPELIFGDRENIGISTSSFEDEETIVGSSAKAPPRSLIAVDVDVKNGVDGYDTIRELNASGFVLPPTYIQTTPTGGQHLVYWTRTPVKNGVGVLGPGVDIRGQGGYIVGAGSRVPAGTYGRVGHPVAEAPAWLIEKCGQARTPQKVPQVLPESVDQEAARARGQEYLDSDACPEGVAGQRNHTAFKVACKLKDLGCDVETITDLLMGWWRCSPPPEFDKIAEIARNAYRYGESQPGRDAFEVQYPPIDDIATTESAAAVEEAPAPERPRFTLIRWDEVELAENVRPLVAGWLQKGELGVVYGASGSGKSFLVLSLAAHVAAGRSWAGNNVEGGPVIYVAAENPGSIKRRILAGRKKMEAGAIPLYLVQDSVNFVGVEPGASSDAKKLAEAISAEVQNPSLVVIDTAAMAMPGADESSARDMGIFIQRALQVKNLTGAAVLLVHHAGKDESRGARGSSALKAAVDVEIYVKRGIAKVTKQRDGVGDSVVYFQLEDVPVGPFEHEVVAAWAAVSSKPFESEDEDDEEDNGGKNQKERPLSLRAVRLFGLAERLMGEEGKCALKDLKLGFVREFEGEIKPTSIETTWSRELGKLKARGWLKVEDGVVTKGEVVNKKEAA